MGAGGSITNSTQDERVQRAGQLYRLLDGDCTGDVDVAELRASFVKMRGGAGAGEDALVTALFDQLDKDHSGSVSLAEFEEVARSLQLGELGLAGSPRVEDEATARQRRTEALRSAFAVLDADSSGAISAEELFATIRALGRGELSAEDASAIVHDFDVSGDGQIQLDEFLAMAALIDQTAADAPGGDAADGAPLPHLVLNVDVNQTCLMIDSATGADIDMIGNMVLASAAWGLATTPAEGAEATWVLESAKPCVLSPSAGLVTYTDWIMHAPLKADKADKAAVKAEKMARRDALRSFTSPGAPGEAWAGELSALIGHLTLPEAARDTPAATRAGLGRETNPHGHVGLLPAFLALLRELKARGRSFSLCFRTFGFDLGKFEQELNALCEGEHPLFPPGASADGGDADAGAAPIVLDGSDGAPDMRMTLGADQIDAVLAAGGDDELASATCGTFHRDAATDEMALVLHTIEQPPQAPPADGAPPPDWDAFYAAAVPRATIVARDYAACAEALQALTARGRPRGTVALRDLFPAWFAAGQQAHGGKPLLLDMRRDAGARGDRAGDRLQIFFDDHVSARDAKIVDARMLVDGDSGAVVVQPAHIAQVFGVHLIRAEPLRSITERRWFIDVVDKAEAAWRDQRRRRRALAKLLDDLESLRAVLGRVQSGGAEAADAGEKYTSFADLDHIKAAPTASAFDDEGH